MTDGGNRFAGFREMTDDFENARVESEVLRRPATGNDERVVIVGPNLVEGRIQSEIVASLLAVGLVTLEIVNSGPHRIASALIRTDGMDDMPDHEERLERDHRFVIFNIIAHQHKQFPDSHDTYSPETIVALPHSAGPREARGQSVYLI